jgi:hypothetical protein
MSWKFLSQLSLPAGTATREQQAIEQPNHAAAEHEDNHQ